VNNLGYFNGIGENAVDDDVVRVGDELTRSHDAAWPERVRVLRKRQNRRLEALQHHLGRDRVIGSDIRYDGVEIAKRRGAPSDRQHYCACCACFAVATLTRMAAIASSCGIGGSGSSRLAWTCVRSHRS